MPDFPLWSAGNGIDRLHTPGSFSELQRFTKPTVDNTKSNWTEVIASTSRAYGGFYLQLNNADAASSTSGVTQSLVDVAIGTTVIVPNILAFNHSQGQYEGCTSSTLFFPLAIPAGVQVQVRLQSLTAAAAGIPAFGVWGVPFDPMLPAPYGRATTYGADTSDSGGVTMDCGAVSNTRVRTQLVASTTNPIRHLTVCVSDNNQTARSMARFLFDIEVGSGFAKVVQDLHIHGDSNENVYPAYFQFPVSIPAGSEINCYHQCSTNGAGTRTFDVALIGLD